MDFLKTAFALWKTQPLFTHFKLPEDKIEDNLRKDEIFVGKLLARWNDHGVRIDCDPDIFLGLMRALFFISLREQDLGRGAYPDVIELFIDSIVQRIVQE